MNQKGTIILCEDENLIALDIKYQLHRLGYNVLKICKTGEDLVKSARELKPGIIITDIQIRGKINGIEAIKIIRRDMSVPFIFLSGQQNNTTFEEAMKEKPNDFVSKPFSVERLSKALASCYSGTIHSDQVNL